MGDYVDRHNKGVLSACERGDLLEFPRGNFSHWAVYVDDEKVIHLTQVMNKGQIKEESFWDVVGESLARLNNYLDGKKNVFTGPEIEERARQKVGPADYDALNYNCEHFVTWCRYGEEISEQAKNSVKKVGIIGTIGTLVTASVSGAASWSR